MLLTRDGKFIRTDIWREGKYLDLWSVPHFLSGMVVGFSLFFLGFALNAALTIAFLVLVAYEMFEVIAQIEETRWNRILDVVVGMASFTPTFLLAPHFNQPYVIVLFIIVLALDGVLSFFGWQASQKASILEGKLRVEVTREKERFTKRRAVFRERWQARRDRHREER
ncbi:hypothetical protein A2765_04705 [Candidatus Kaiserbacteria bacterium RIFCSPHIGHO2_01_FULL_56_24]|uniref:Uncharacterized protein n=1 Tax=Candidatus Kaiserbacteria bacterium RIFCSPHIGHO2_01_FULL_56_24 TaxID=1798487 RepID=A0A1F6DEW0_9BACT|nr:MAG: hypothetical protein A2765_04705 [Candidatus Kaiserbacteria bacterium RIFCSPHIGHO2_01_FULL_56_24]